MEKIDFEIDDLEKNILQSWLPKKHNIQKYQLVHMVTMCKKYVKFSYILSSFIKSSIFTPNATDIL